MLKRTHFFVLFLTLITGFIISGFKGPTPPSCREILEQMVTTINEVKTLKYNLKFSERFKNKYTSYSSSVKLQRKPRKIYLFTKGIELLWKEGWNKGQALVKPNFFPYISMNLDPEGNLMRDDQHHTIHQIGFDYFGDIIDYNLQTFSESFDEHFKFEGEETINNRPCYKITITNDDFRFIPYTVKKGENLVTIARKLYISEYMILEQNKPKVDDYKDVKEGQVIQIPSAYAKYVILYIDKYLHTPTAVRVFDNKGLFETYDYFFVQINPKIEDAEFEKNYPGYKF